MLVFNNYFCKNRNSKLHFGDRVAVLNVFLYQTGGSTILNYKSRTYVDYDECIKVMAYYLLVRSVFFLLRLIDLSRDFRSICVISFLTKSCLLPPS
jgi:hypothetical protein